MSRGWHAEFPPPAVKDERPAPILIEPRRFAVPTEDGNPFVVDMTAWPAAAFTAEMAPLVRARLLRMGPSLIRRSVQRQLLGLRRFWIFLTEQGDVPVQLADLTVATIDDYETWLERRGGGRIQQRQLLAAVIGVLRAGAEDYPGLLPSELMPRLRFLGHGFVGGSIPRDAYGGRIAEALRVAARRQIHDAQSRIALGEGLPPHPSSIAACPRLSAHHDAVLAEIAARGQIGTRHAAFIRFANLAGRRKLDIGIEVPHRGFHLGTADLAPFLILLSLETGMETESLIRLKADCLCNPTRGYVEIAYYKRRARGAEWKRLRVRDGSTATPGGLIRLAIALTDRARLHLGSDRLWVLWTVTGLRPVGEDVRKGTCAFLKHHGLKDDNGKPLHLNLSRLRKTQKAEWYRRTGGQMEQFAVGHSIAVAARHYAEIPALAHVHDAALAAAFHDALDAARIVPSPENDVIEATDAGSEETPGRDDADGLHGLDPQDLWLARCDNFFASPFGAEGKPCPTPFWGCLECRNAVISEAKLPALIAFQTFMADQRTALHAEDWAIKFARPFARITDQILPTFPLQVVEAARHLASSDDPALLYLPVEASAL
jgi:hypothetical protein